MAKLLEISNLTTHFFTQDGVVKAVDGITYDLEEGEVLGVVGESGCGKSVHALSIMRLVPSPPGRTVAGEVVFEGEDLLNMDDAEMRNIRGNRIAMVFQEPMTSLNPVLTIGRQLTETLELHQKMSKQQAKVRAAELLQTVGISDAERRLADYPHQFSGGMRQRVLIAMAVTIQAQILELMQDLARDFGTAMIIITHNLGVVARYADNVNVMYAGKIIETGSALEIYHNPKHPYTLALLNSVPRLDASERIRLDVIEGLPPDLVNLADGCSFAPRCKYVYERCIDESPVLEDALPGHTTACWRHHELRELAGIASD